MTPDEEERWEGVASFAQALANAGRWQEAEALTLLVPESTELTGYLFEKTVALASVGKAALRVGVIGRAEKALAEAERLAHVLGKSKDPYSLARGGDWKESYALYDIAEAWDEGGREAEAARLRDAVLEAAGRGFDTDKLIARLARDFKRLGLEDRVAAAVQLLPGGYPWQQAPTNSLLDDDAEWIRFREGLKRRRSERAGEQGDEADKA